VRRLRRAWRAAALAPLLLAVGACNDDGRTLDPAPEVPISPETTGAPSGPDTIEADTAAPLRLTISSPSFADGAPLDPEFTCDGLNVPPPLTITGVPPSAVELAITVVDVDAGGDVHWVLTGVPPTVTQLDSGVVPPAAVSGLTDSGVAGWDGPCPPEGDGPHQYVFTVYALAEPLGLTPGTEGRQAIELIESSALLASARTTGTYEA
jgi:hypothetical protein